MSDLKFTTPIQAQEIKRQAHELYSGEGTFYQTISETNHLRDNKGDTYKKVIVVRMIGGKSMRTTQVSKNGELTETIHDIEDEGEVDDFNEAWNENWPGADDDDDHFFDNVGPADLVSSALSRSAGAGAAATAAAAAAAEEEEASKASSSAAGHDKSKGSSQGSESGSRASSSAAAGSQSNNSTTSGRRSGGQKGPDDGGEPPPSLAKRSTTKNASSAVRLVKIEKVTSKEGSSKRSGSKTKSDPARSSGHHATTGRAASRAASATPSRGGTGGNRPQEEEGTQSERGARPAAPGAGGKGQLVSVEHAHQVTEWLCHPRLFHVAQREQDAQLPTPGRQRAADGDESLGDVSVGDADRLDDDSVSELVARRRVDVSEELSPVQSHDGAGGSEVQVAHDSREISASTSDTSSRKSEAKSVTKYDMDTTAEEYPEDDDDHDASFSKRFSTREGGSKKRSEMLLEVVDYEVVLPKEPKDL